MKTLIKTLSAAAALVAVAAAPAQAEEAGPVDSQSWTFTGPLGFYDERQLQRGLYIYQTRCQACHSLGLVRFSSLADLGWELLEGQTGEDVAKAIESRNPLGRNGRTADVAATLLYLVSPGGAFTNGAIIPLDGGGHLHKDFT